MVRTALLALSLLIAPVQQQQATPHADSAERADQQSAKAVMPVRGSPPTVDERVADYTRWLAIFSGGLFVVTGVLALYTYRLWGATKRLVEDNGSNARRQLRAYVFLESTKPRGTVPAYPEVASYLFVFKNSGQTPASHVEVIIARIFVSPGEKQFPAIPAMQPASLVAIGPGGSVNTRTAARQLTPAETAAIIAGTHQLSLHGKITYVDAFGVGRETCFRMIREAGGHDLAATYEGNEAD